MSSSTCHDNACLVINPTCISSIVFQGKISSAWRDWSEAFVSNSFITGFTPGTISAVRCALLPPQPPRSTVEFGRESGVQTVGSDLAKLWRWFKFNEADTLIIWQDDMLEIIGLNGWDQSLSPSWTYLCFRKPKWGEIHSYSRSILYDKISISHDSGVKFGCTSKKTIVRYLML